MVFLLELNMIAVHVLMQYTEGFKPAALSIHSFDR